MNKRVVILAGILVCFAVVVQLASAANYYNYVYNGTTEKLKRSLFINNE